MKITRRQLKQIIKEEVRRARVQLFSEARTEIEKTSEWDREFTPYQWAEPNINIAFVDPDGRVSYWSDRTFLQNTSLQLGDYRGQLGNDEILAIKNHILQSKGDIKDTFRDSNEDGEWDTDEDLLDTDGINSINLDKIVVDDY